MDYRKIYEHNRVFTANVVIDQAEALAALLIQITPKSEKVLAFPTPKRPRHRCRGPSVAQVVDFTEVRRKLFEIADENERLAKEKTTYIDEKIYKILQNQDDKDYTRAVINAARGVDAIIGKIESFGVPQHLSNYYSSLKDKFIIEAEGFGYCSLYKSEKSELAQDKQASRPCLSPEVVAFIWERYE